ncbi:MAG: hypothetical protein IJB11_04730 [Oscillospiraceae bacterium]|nr:hypothetical protein [Oscillospiraceae bacterium]
MILLLLALAILVLPLQWVVAAVAAAAFHELCHVLAVKACGGKIIRFRAGISGANMEAAGLSDGQIILCALAGPLGGLSLLLLVRWIPRIALCAAAQSLFNLMPLYPLDGGRALHYGAGLLFPRRATAICGWIRGICLTGIWLFGLYGTVVLRLGILPLGLVVFIFIKMTCKPAPH